MLGISHVLEGLMRLVFEKIAEPPSWEWGISIPSRLSTRSSYFDASVAIPILRLSTKSIIKSKAYPSEELPFTPSHPEQVPIDNPCVYKSTLLTCFKSHDYPVNQVATGSQDEHQIV